MPVRALQAQRETPTLARARQFSEDRGSVLGERRPVPGSEDPRGQPVRGGLDIEGEAQAALARGGQAGDDTHRLHVHAFQFRVEAVGEPQVGEP